MLLCMINSARNGGGGGNHVASESKHPVCTPRPPPWMSLATRQGTELSGWHLHRGHGWHGVGETQGD